LVAVVIYAVCGIAGRSHLMTILSNFLSVIGYWTICLFTIVLEEDLIFRRKSGYDVDSYSDKTRLPWGIAAVFSFLLGIVGAVLGMNQTWYVGVVGRQIGDMGGDMGVVLALIFTGVSFPILRWLERRHTGR
jgi:purine-cytosine permease-like protein